MHPSYLVSCLFVARTLGEGPIFGGRHNCSKFRLKLAMHPKFYVVAEPLRWIMATWPEFWQFSTHASNEKIWRWSHISEGWVNSARSGPLLTSSTKSVGGLPKRKPEPSKERAGPWPLVLGHDYLVKCRLWGFAPKLPSFNCLTEDRALLLRGFMTVSLSSSRHPAQVLPLCLSSPSFESLLPRNQWYLIDNRLNHDEKLYIDNNFALACHPFPLILLFLGFDTCDQSFDKAQPLLTLPVVVFAIKRTCKESEFLD